MYDVGFCNGRGWPATLHNYEVVRENAGGIYERCTRCGRPLLTNKAKDGQIDNVIYLKEHIRDFLQPFSRYYDREYGEGASSNFGKQ